MAVVAIFLLPSPFILLTLLIKMRRCFYFVKLKTIPPVNPKFISPDNDLRYVEGKEEGEKRGNRKTGKHGCQLAEGDSPKKDEVEEKFSSDHNLGPQTSSNPCRRIFLDGITHRT